MEMSSVADMIAEFVTTESKQLGIGEVAPDTELLELGILDSLSMINLLSFLESSLGVRVPEDQLLPENFATPRAIAQLICRSAA
jgi:acyl carrier protein